MKNKFRLIITIILLFTLSAVFSICASAQEEHESMQTEETQENFFARIYNEVSEYASEILCAMTFTGSVILAVAYKKGLLPLLEKSLITIGNAVAKIKESTNDTAEKSAVLEVSIEKRLTETQALIESIAERIGTLESDLKCSMENEDEAKLESKQLRLVQSAQIDMLYDIFMSSALPQYQKDAIGEKVARMKEAIAENANSK